MKQSSRFEMRLAPELLERIDAWRREQPDIPTRAEAARRLVLAALAAAETTPAKPARRVAVPRRRRA